MKNISSTVIREAQAGDTCAFEVIYRHLSPSVYAVSLKIMGHEADARDVTQEVFITLFHKLAEFRHESALKTWAYRVTVNTALNMRKKRSRIEGPVVAFDEEMFAHGAEPEVLARERKAHQARVTSKLLEKLNPEQRVCLILRGVEGLSYQEIADILRININTVRTRIRRARQMLLALKNEVVAHEM